MTSEDRLAAEQRARVLIDRQLTGAGWVVQDRKDLNLFAGQGVVVNEVIMAKGHGRADYPSLTIRTVSSTAPPSVARTITIRRRGVSDIGLRSDRPGSSGPGATSG